MNNECYSIFCLDHLQSAGSTISGGRLHWPI